MLGEILRFLVLWVAVFAIFSIIPGLALVSEKEHDIVRRAAWIGFLVATGTTVVAVVMRLAMLAVDHIPR